jgi:TRAP-type uncharacterized transport system substrate-binding protein
MHKRHKITIDEDKIVNGELQGFVIMEGAPMDAVIKLIRSGISLVPIHKDVAEKIHQAYPYLVPGIFRPMSIPLHEGAKRFYREKGMTVKEAK